MSENQRFPNVGKGYRSETLVENGLIGACLECQYGNVKIKSDRINFWLGKINCIDWRFLAFESMIAFSWQLKQKRNCLIKFMLTIRGPLCNICWILTKNKCYTKDANRDSFFRDCFFLNLKIQQTVFNSLSQCCFT